MSTAVSTKPAARPLSPLRILSHALRHPLNHGRPLAAIGRIARWQVASRLVDGGLVLPFVGGSRLLIRRGMHGATGNVYCGLQDYEDMAFTMHSLRPGDRFIDVGANVGVYTVLAAAAVGARVIAFEPAPASVRALQDNVRLNGIEGLVEIRAEAVGARCGELRLTLSHGPVNHVVAADEADVESVGVPLVTLDAVVGGELPTLVKIDVEGFEGEVIAGATRLLRHPGLMAIIVELNGSGERYGAADRNVAEAVQDAGFRPYRYVPDRRLLVMAENRPGKGDNTIFVRDVAAVSERLRTAPRRDVGGTTL